MWTTLLAALSLAHAGSGLVLRRFSVPSAPEYGSTVQLEADYQLGGGEYIQRLRWSKDGVPLMTYTEEPRNHIEWGSVSGVTIDQDGSSPSRVVLTNVGDGASGQYSLELSVSGTDGNVANIANSNYMSVGGTGAGGLGTRFGGFGGFGGLGGVPGTTFQSSSSSAGGSVDGLGTRGGFSSTTSGGPGGQTTFTSSSGPGGGTSFSSSTTSTRGNGGVQTSFQSSSTNGNGGGGGFNFGPNFPFGANFPFGSGLRNRGQFGGGSINYATASQAQLTAALQQAERDIQRAQTQLNLIQEALANLEADY